MVAGRAGAVTWRLIALSVVLVAFTFTPHHDDSGVLAKAGVPGPLAGRRGSRMGRRQERDQVLLYDAGVGRLRGRGGLEELGRR